MKLVYVGVKLLLQFKIIRNRLVSVDITWKFEEILENVKFSFLIAVNFQGIWRVRLNATSFMRNVKYVGELKKFIFK